MSTLHGNTTVQAHAPVERSPLFVVAGSILTMGPFVQNTKFSSKELEIRVYPGGAGKFSLYEDDGMSAAPCPSSRIEFVHDDAASTLTIGARIGAFPDMLVERTMSITLVKEGHGAGLAINDTPDTVVTYTGERVTVSLKH